MSKVGYAEVDHMVVDILTWGLYFRAPSNLMIISNKNISEGTELFGVLEDLRLMNYNILVSSLGEDAPAGDMVRLSTSVFGVGTPLNQSISCSHGLSNKQQLAHDGLLLSLSFFDFLSFFLSFFDIDISFSPLLAWAVANTGVFWYLDDCEIPDDIDHIYQNVKTALANQGCHGQMSIWAYCVEDKAEPLPLPGITLVSAGLFPFL